MFYDTFIFYPWWLPNFTRSCTVSYIDAWLSMQIKESKKKKHTSSSVREVLSISAHLANLAQVFFSWFEVRSVKTWYTMHVRAQESIHVGKLAIWCFTSFSSIQLLTNLTNKNNCRDWGKTLGGKGSMLASCDYFPHDNSHWYW